MAALPKKVGWVGLGLMGYPMANNLLNKMPDAEFFVYDVIQDSIDKFVKDGNGRVQACASSKEVADKSVCHASNIHSRAGATSVQADHWLLK